MPRSPVKRTKKARLPPRIWTPPPYRPPPPEPPADIRAAELAVIERMVEAKLVTKLEAQPARILGESSPGWRRKVELKSTTDRNRYLAEQKRLANRILPDDAPIQRRQRRRPETPQPERPTLKKRSRSAPD